MLISLLLNFIIIQILEKRGRKRKKDDFDENSMGLDDPVLLAVNEEGNLFLQNLRLNNNVLLIFLFRGFA